VVLVLVESYN